MFFDTDTQQSQRRDKRHYDQPIITTIVLKNLYKLTERPARLQEKVFEKIFRLAEVAKFSPEERGAYNDSLKYYRDLKNSLDTSFEEGKMEGKTEVIRHGYLKGLPT
jgi:PD-(D/E)XK nuclease family transposase